MDLSVPARARVALAAVILVAAASWCPAGAQTLVSHVETTSFASGLPEDTGSSWSRVGTGHALLVEDELLLNDNSTAHLIAYQGLLGRIEAVHDVAFRAELKVVSNLGGDGALIEVSRPGMEVLVQLYPEGIVVLEREGRDGERWLGSVDADLSEYREVSVHKTSRHHPDGEQVAVAIDGVEVLRVTPHGTGDLDVGRVLFGSLGYLDFGATLWRWVEVDAHLDQQKTPADTGTVGRLKGRFRD